MRYLSHQEFEVRNPRARKYAEDFEHARRKNYMQAHEGSADGYRPLREYPCKGTLVLDRIPDETNPAALASCDACGHEEGVTIADPIFASSALGWAADRAGVPAHHRARKTVRDEFSGPAMDALDAFVEGYVHGGEKPARPPLLAGPTGTGKTQLLVYVARKLLTSSVNVRFYGFASLLEAEKDSFRTKVPSPIKTAIGVPVIILDDLGSEQGTPFALEALQRLVDGRYEKNYPILAATNFEPQEWEGAFGKRTASRITEICEPLFVGGPDRRLAS